MWQMGFQRKMLEDRTRTFGEAHMKTEEAATVKLTISK